MPRKSLKERTAILNIPPKRIRKDDKWTVWHKVDMSFGQPKTYSVISLAVPSHLYDESFVINTKIFSFCFQESITEYLYDANLAGLSLNLEFTSKGLQLIMKLTNYY